jgi:hypothetical protein
MLMTSGQLASYDQIKEALLKTSWFKDDVVTHLTAGSISGVIATVICSPIDVIKTRLMNMKEGQYKGFSLFHFLIFFSGIGDCFMKTIVNEGVFAFFKGFGPNVSRLVPHTMLTFIFLEKYKQYIDSLSSK